MALKLADRDAETRARMGAAEQPRRLLGLLLIEMGLISEEQLVQALEAQEPTGELLGEVLIGLGFLSRLTLQDALAKQRGVLLKPDPGFGGGLRGELIRRESRWQSSVHQQPLGIREIESHGTQVPEASIAGLQHEPRVGPWNEKELELQRELGELRADVGRHEERLAELERELEATRHALTVALRGTPPRYGLAIRLAGDQSCPADSLSEPFLATVGRARKHVNARRAALHQRSAVFVQQ